MILSTKMNKGAEAYTKSNKITMPVGPHDDLLTGKIAIDCEMMQSNIGQVLGRVSVVNYEGDTIYNTFVCYPEPITITNTEEGFSGIDWKNGGLSFPEVQARLVELLRDRIVIGHDIQKDLKVISMDLPSHILRLQGVAVWLTPVTFEIAVNDTQNGSVDDSSIDDSSNNVPPTNMPTTNEPPNGEPSNKPTTFETTRDPSTTMSLEILGEAPAIASLIDGDETHVDSAAERDLPKITHTDEMVIVNKYFPKSATDSKAFAWRSRG